MRDLGKLSSTKVAKLNQAVRAAVKMVSSSANVATLGWARSSATNADKSTNAHSRVVFDLRNPGPLRARSTTRHGRSSIWMKKFGRCPQLDRSQAVTTERHYRTVRLKSCTPCHERRVVPSSSQLLRAPETMKASKVAVLRACLADAGLIPRTRRRLQRASPYANGAA